MTDDELKSVDTEALERELARRRAGQCPLENLCALEDEIEAEAQRLKQVSLEARVAGLVAENDAPKPCPKCGKAVRVRVRNKERTVLTRAGSLSLRRNYHYCDRCKGGFFPRDRELGLPPEGDVSFGLEARIVDLGINETFERAAQRWAFHYGFEISSNLVRRVIDRVGRRCADSDLRYLQHSLQEPTATPCEMLLVQTDGSMVAVRHEDEAWKEVKLGVVVRSDHLAKNNERGVVSQARYVGVLGSKDDFARGLAHTIAVEKKTSTQKVVWIGDGAPWIWNLASQLCPNATQVLDWYHALEHALECGKALLSDGSLLGDWERTVRHLLSEGRISELINQLMDCLELAAGPQIKPLNDLVRYYRNNAERMRYNEYRAAKYPIGSGIVESAHGHVIQQRMKRTGQRWSLSRGDRMARLRCAYRSTQPKHFHRAIRLAAEATRVAPIPERTIRRASNR